MSRGIVLNISSLLVSSDKVYFSMILPICINKATIIIITVWLLAVGQAVDFVVLNNNMTLFLFTVSFES